MLNNYRNGRVRALPTITHHLMIMPLLIMLVLIKESFPLVLILLVDVSFVVGVGVIVYRIMKTRADIGLYYS